MRLLLLLLFTVSARLCSQERIFYLSGENLQDDSVQRFLQPGGEHLPQVVPDGYRGAGLRFDGQDTLLRLKPGPELAFAADQSFTVELYYFPEKVSRSDGEMYWAGLVTRGSFAGSYWRLRSHSLKGTPLFQGTNRENGKMVVRCQIVRKIQEMAGQWHHVALVRDAHKRLLSLYHNGVLVKQELEVDPQVFENPGQDLLIGQTFTGLIDELSIYDGIRHTFSPPQNEAAPEQAAIAVDAALQTNWQACRERGLHLYPMPKELHFSGQEFAFNPAAWSVQRHNGTDAPGLQAFRQRLQDCGLTDALAEGEGTGNLIVSGLFADLPTELALLSSPALPPRQGYVLGFAGQPGQRRIILAGSDEDGLRYAWLTLGNLLREGGSIFPALIRDWPDCLRRGIEISGPLSSDFVDMAFRMRINLLHRGRHAYSSDKDREQVRQFNDYAFERGILVEIAFHTNVLDLGPDYQKYITPGYNSHYYMYKPEEGLFGYLNGAYSWSRDDLARARGQQLAKEMKDLHFRSIYFHAIDRGGFNDPGNWARRLPQDRERWGDDQASADAHLLSIYVEELRREIPDIVIYYVQYPYVPTKDAKVLKYYRDLSAKLDGKVIHLLREAPRQLLASTVAAFRHPPRMCFYPYPFTVYPSYSNSGRFVASLYFGLQTIVRVCHWNPTSSLALASDWVFAEYLWNPFSPGAEPLPPDKHTLPVVLAPSEPIEQELLPRICALFFAEV